MSLLKNLRRVLSDLLGIGEGARVLPADLRAGGLPFAMLAFPFREDFIYSCGLSVDSSSRKRKARGWGGSSEGGLLAL